MKPSGSSSSLRCFSASCLQTNWIFQLPAYGRTKAVWRSGSPVQDDNQREGDDQVGRPFCPKMSVGRESGLCGPEPLAKDRMDSPAAICGPMSHTPDEPSGSMSVRRFLLPRALSVASSRTTRQDRSRCPSYNTNRPHSSLNGLTPTEFAARPRPKRVKFVSPER